MIKIKSNILKGKKTETKFPKVKEFNIGNKQKLHKNKNNEKIEEIEMDKKEENDEINPKINLF